jgi:hypothetical protein
MSTLTTTIDGEVVTWKDRKRYLWLFGLVVPLLPFGAGNWVEYEGLGEIMWFSGPIWILVMIPLLDAIFGTDRSNAPDWAVEQLAEDRYYRWCTFLFLPLQYASLIYACWIVSTNDLLWWQQLGYALTVGTVAGVAINTAHELGQDPGLSKDGVEAHLQELLAADPTAIAAGLTLVRREYPTDIGPVDLLCRDADGNAVAIEVPTNGVLYATDADISGDFAFRGAPIYLCGGTIRWNNNGNARTFF